MKRKMLAVIISVICIATTSLTAFADMNNYSKQRLADNATVFAEDSHDDDLGYVPDYFAENGIDTTQHIPLSMTKTTAQLNTMISTTYPNGSYYSTTGSQCSSHTNCAAPSSSTATVCVSGCGTCKAYEASIQCQAFARLAYYTRNGKSITVGSTTTAKSITNSIISSNFTAGTMVRLTTSSGTIHSVLVVANDTSANKVSIYHANYGGRCKVVYQTVTYADFISAFPTYYYYSNP